MIIRIIEKLKIGGVEKGILRELEEIEDYKLIVIDEIVDNVLPKRHDKKVLVLGLKWYQLLSLKKFIDNTTIRGKVIIASLWKSFLFGIIFAKTKKIKLITFFHSDRFTNIFNFLISIFAISQSSKVFCDSLAVKDKISEFTNSKNIEIIPFNFTETNTTNIVDFSTGLKPVYIGRISQEKRIDLILKLHKKISKTTQINNIMFYGPIEHKKSLKIINDYLGAEYCGVIRFDNVNQKLKEFNCIFLLSDREGMGEVIFNSMSFGLIPIVRDIGELKNYIKNKKNGFVSNNLNLLAEYVAEAYRAKNLLKISNEARLVKNKVPKYIDEFLKYAR